MRFSGLEVSVVESHNDSFGVLELGKEAELVFWFGSKLVFWFRSKTSALFCPSEQCGGVV